MPRLNKNILRQREFPAAAAHQHPTDAELCSISSNHLTRIASYVATILPVLDIPKKSLAWSSRNFNLRSHNYRYFNTVDGSEILLINQRLVVEIPLFARVFSTIQPVVVWDGISQASTVIYAYGHPQRPPRQVALWFQGPRRAHPMVVNHHDAIILKTWAPGRKTAINGVKSRCIDVINL